MKEYLVNPEWRQILKSEMESPYFLQLTEFLDQQYEASKTIYPAKPDIFSALNLTAPSKVKAVILGQDPYHGPNQAHGLSFSVKKGIKIPPSLVNIYKELHSDLNLPVPDHGFLESWAKEGVLLLNNTLTVEDAKPASHQKKGWEIFTDKIIRYLNDSREHLVFILWGAPAQKKASFLDETKHLVIHAPHPSPLSSYRGFFGSKPFSKTNEYLSKNKIKPINWEIT